MSQTKRVVLIEKLAAPTEQVGMPATHKWAVYVDGAFCEAYRTKREALALADRIRGEA